MDTRIWTGIFLTAGILAAMGLTGCHGHFHGTRLFSKNERWPDSPLDVETTELPNNSFYRHEPRSIEPAPSAATPEEPSLAPPAASYEPARLSNEAIPNLPPPPLPAEVHYTPVPGPFPTMDGETTSHRPESAWPDPFSEPVETQQRLLPPPPASPRLFRRMRKSFKRIMEPTSESDSHATNTNRHKSVRGRSHRSAQKNGRVVRSRHSRSVTVASPKGRTKRRQAARRANTVVLGLPEPERRPEPKQGWSVDWPPQIAVSIPHSSSTRNAPTQNRTLAYWPRRSVPMAQGAIPVSRTRRQAFPVFAGPVTPDPTLHLPRSW